MSINTSRIKRRRLFLVVSIPALLGFGLVQLLMVNSVGVEIWLLGLSVALCMV